MVAALLAVAALVRVSDFGWNGTNDTVAVRAAVSSGAKTVVFDRQKGPWRTDTVRVGSDVELVFEEDVEVVAVKGGIADAWASLFEVISATNIVFRGEGGGATLRMLKDGYLKESYGGRIGHRHGINLLSAVRVTIENLRIAESGGDGIYLGESYKGGLCLAGVRGIDGPCRDIVIRNCTLDRHLRQGMSVISAENLLLENCVLSNTSGAMPQSGIDFEPNFEHDKLVNCVMRNCLSLNNAGSGYEFYLGNLDRTTAPTDIRIENCRSVGNLNGILYSVRRPGDMPTGEVRFSNCSFADARGPAVRMYSKDGDAVRLTLADCTISNACTESGASDVFYRSDSWCECPPDGFLFSGLKIVQTKKHPWFLWDENRCLNPRRVTDFRGDVMVIGPDGRRTRQALDADWRTRTFAPKSEKPVLAHVAAANPPVGIEVRDEAPGRSVKLAPVIPHWRAFYIFFVDRPGEVKFTWRQQVDDGVKLPVGPFLVCHEKKEPEPIRIAAPGRETESRSFRATKRGFYTMRTDVGPICPVMETCNVPVAIDMQERLHEIKLCDSNPVDLWLDVPDSGNCQFVVSGTSAEKRFGVTVFDLGGNVLSQATSAYEWTELDVGTVPGLRRVRFAPPSTGALGVGKVDLAGGTASLFLSREKTWHLKGK